MLGQCGVLAHLNLSYNDFGDAGAESFAGALGQCAALAYLDLRQNQIGPEVGAESFAGVLGQCASLAHLDLSGNNGIGTAGAEWLRASRVFIGLKSSSARLTIQVYMTTEMTLLSPHPPRPPPPHSRASRRDQPFGLVL